MTSLRGSKQHPVLVLAVLGHFLTLPLLAQTPRLGDEQQVNAYTTGFQFAPAVDGNGHGGFVAVWTSESSPTDGSGYSVMGRRMAPGNVLGDEFQVNGVTTGDQQWPAVAVHRDDTFVVVWASPGDGDDNGVVGRRFGSDGGALGAEFQVNAYSTAGQSYPAIDGRSDGDFVVVWSSFGSPGDDSDAYSIQVRPFGSDGTALGDAFQVNTYTAGDQVNPKVRWTSDDAFVVVWTSNGSAADDSSLTSVQGRLFASDGTALTGEIQLNSYTTGRQQYADVMRDGSNLLVAWSSGGSAGNDTDQSSIQGRLFDGSVGGGLAALGDQFQINTYTPGFQISTSVTAKAAGGFVVAWESLGSPGDDTSDRSVQGQELDASGAPVGDQFQINTFTNNYQLLPRVAADRTDGDYVVVWNSSGSGGNDLDSTSVQTQRFGERLFANGFEGGDLTGWDNSTP